MWFQSSKDLKFDSCDNLEGLVLLELEASQFVAWLHGNQDTGGGKHHIGLATSPDMLIWTMYGENPILQPGNDGEWDEHRVENAFVAKDDLGTDTLRIWYSGAPSSDGEDGSAIGYATSDQRTV